MAKEGITIEQLAEMIQKGFQQTATKAELKDFQRITIEEFERIHADLRDIKVSLGPLVRLAADQDRVIQELLARMTRVEKKVGLAR